VTYAVNDHHEIPKISIKKVGLNHLNPYVMHTGIQWIKYPMKNPYHITILAGLIIDFKLVLGFRDAFPPRNP